MKGVGTVGRLRYPLLATLALTAAAADGDEKKTDPPQGKVRWSFNAGGTVRGRLVVSSGVCVASVFRCEADGKGKVVALDADIGKLLWEFKAPDQHACPCAVWKDAVILGTADGTLHALDLKSGKPRWKAELKAPLTGHEGYPTVALTGDRVAVVAPAKFAAVVDCTTGKTVWKKDGPFTAVAADDRTVYVVAPDQQGQREPAPIIVALKAEDGKEAWRFDAHKGLLSTFAGLGQDAEHLYAATYSDAEPPLLSKQYVYALWKRDGTVAWKVEQKKSNRKGPYVLAGKVYVTDWSGTSMMLNAGTGELVAKRNLTDDSFPIADGVVLDILTAYDLKTEKQVWTAAPLPKGMPLQNSLLAVPTAHGSRVYADHPTGHVICIE